MRRDLSADDRESRTRAGLTCPDVGKDIFMVSVTIQPEHDTPEVLAAYARIYGVGPGWLFLTGKKTGIELLRHRLGFVDSDPAQLVPCMIRKSIS
jgi:cytochrome oxidase Cu insertion factor (SCO1/SenC/PrrC family)